MSHAARYGRRLAAVATATAVLGTASFGTAQPAQASLLGGLLGTVTGLLDTTLGLVTGADWGYAPSTARMPEVVSAVRADQLWTKGLTGRGVGVALIDTGVVPVQGLTNGNVVNGPDLSFDGQSPSPNLDGFGHGTHMAGIIAGNDGTATGFKGVAPDATLLSVRVGAHDGAADVSQVVAAVDWVVQHRADNGMNIRVLNLSFGTDGTQASTLDPLTHAVENAWRAGIVVVVSGGNGGTTRASLDNPARDPYVLAVGADDTHGSALSTSNDTVPDFSSRGSTSRYVDVIAPGQSVASLRDPGSSIDVAYPGAVVDSRLFKGSGTSQAAAVVSGATALLLQARPTLTPDQVKALLRSTAQPLYSTSARAQGAGLINVAAAAAAAAPTTAQGWTRSTGLGSLELARGTNHVGDDGVDLTGERDIFGRAWSATTWAPASTAGTSWTNGTFNGAEWTGTCWCGTSWASRTWSGTAWTSRTWSSRTWSSTAWDSRTWSSRTWSGDDWTSRTWSSRTWSGSSWSSAGTRG